MSDVVLRRFARDQWVRLHGTPRITVLVGDGQALWLAWLEAAGLEGILLDGALDSAVPDAAARASASPATPIAIACSSEALYAWRAQRSDRLAALVDEGVIAMAEIANAPRRSHLIDARSAAEAALYEALEATPATAGKFELNGYLAVRFGSNAAEVDLLAREDRIAIEVDGYHHLNDLDAYRRDREKDLLLQLQGLVVIRALARDVMKDARPVVTSVCRVLAARKRGTR